MLVRILARTQHGKHTVWSWAVIEADAPSELVGASRDVVIRGPATASPPTTRLRFCSGVRISLAGVILRRGDIRDVDAVELLQPLLDLVRVCKSECQYLLSKSASKLDTYRLEE